MQRICGVTENTQNSKPDIVAGPGVPVQAGGGTVDSGNVNQVVVNVPEQAAAPQLKRRTPEASSAYRFTDQRITRHLDVAVASSPTPLGGRRGTRD